MDLHRFDSSLNSSKTNEFLIMNEKNWKIKLAVSNRIYNFESGLKVSRFGFDGLNSTSGVSYIC